jgi:acyl-CoA thioester hydrolase
LTEISKVSFALYYKLEKADAEKPVVVALAKTGMVCYDYQAKKITPVPERIKIQFTQ